MNPMQAIQVFCGASTGFDPVYVEAAQQVGRGLAQQQIQLVYGAGSVGLMGVMADACLEAGGHVIGVIPYFLQQLEVCHEGLSELILTDTMYERKVRMLERSDATIALPGGFGTLDEVFEVITLVQLQQTFQPIGFLNIKGYYDHLLAHCKRMLDEGFLRQVHYDALIVADDIDELLQKMNDARPAAAVKWVNP